MLAYMNRHPYVRIILCLLISHTLLLSGCSRKTPPTSTGAEASHKQGETALETPIPSQDITYTMIEWTDLLPDDDLEALENPPEYLADIEDGSEDDQLTSQLKAEALPSDQNDLDSRYDQALVSKNVRPEFDGRHIRIPGFIVPLEFDDQQTITTFFLVPFFGACIHVPPPPPNQIVYAEFESGIQLEALYDPFWISGTIHTSLVENDMATAAYSMTVTAIEPYITDSFPYEKEDDAEFIESP